MPGTLLRGRQWQPVGCKRHLLRWTPKMTTLGLTRGHSSTAPNLCQRYGRNDQGKVILPQHSHLLPQD